MNHLRPLRKHFWKHRYRLGLGLIFIVASNYFGILAPQLTGYIIRKVEGNPNPAFSNRHSYDALVDRFIQYIESASLDAGNLIAFAGIAILVLALLRGAFMFLMRQTIVVMSRLIEYDQKEEVYAQYQRLDTAFYKRSSVGDLMVRMAEDVSRVRMYTGPAIMYLANLITLIGLTVVFMWRQNAELTLYVLAPLPLLAVIIYRVNTLINKRSEAVQAALSGLTTAAQQTYSGIRVVKSFHQQAAIGGHFAELSGVYRSGATQLAKIESLYFPSMAFFIGVSTLVTIYMGGLKVDAGEIDIAAVVEFVIYINMLTFPVSAIGWTASMIQRAAASQKRLNEFLDLRPEAGHTGTERFSLENEIRFENVSFTYPDSGVQALIGVSFTIPAGKRTALMGTTGGGKTTVFSLLLGFYPPDNGSITLDGKPLESIDLKSLRERIGYVPQDGFLFSDTVANNIAFGLAESDEAAVREAAEAADVHSDILDFPKGYATITGERGVTLSGGQKQRISIARALVKKPTLLLLDDALSAVDNQTERNILQRLDTWTADMTLISVTHKVEGLHAYDHVVLFDEGQVIESGAPEELLQKASRLLQMRNERLG